MKNLIIGDWDVLEIETINDEGESIYGNKSYFETINDEDALTVFRIVFRFCEDGRCLNLMPLTKDFTAKDAKSEGMEIVDNMAIIESTQWKEENEKLWFDTGINREIAGIELSSFDEIFFDSDIMALPGIRLVRKK